MKKIMVILMTIMMVVGFYGREIEAENLTANTSEYKFINVKDFEDTGVSCECGINGYNALVVMKYVTEDGIAYYEMERIYDISTCRAKVTLENGDVYEGIETWR